MRRPISLTARLALLFALSSSAVLLVLGWVIGTGIEQHFERMDTDTLRGKLVLAQHLIERVSSEDELRALPAQLGDAFIGHHGLVFQVLGPQGRVILSSGEATLFPRQRLSGASPVDAAQLFAWKSDGREFHGLAAAIPTAIPGLRPLSLGVAIDVAEHRAFMTSFRMTLWTFMAGAACVTGLLGWITARRGLAPLREMRERAASITAQRLDRRLPAAAVPRELADLAMTLNATFERLEEAFQRLSHFSSDIAHELRTPVSNLMTQTQVCLSRTRDADSYRAVLESNVEEFERLSHMIAQMLYLAKAENGLLIPQLEQVDLAGLVRDLFDFYEVLAEEKNIRLVFHGDACIAGDRHMLRRAVSNLLSNAIRHAQAGSEVTVHVAGDGSLISLSVENRGETIPPQHLPHIFDRFYRADPARHHTSSEGAGLGLAITRAIVLAHGGEVAAESGAGFTRVAIRLPQAGQAPATTLSAARQE